MVDKWHKEIGRSFCTPLSLYSLCMQSSISHTHFGNACVWFSHSSWSRWRIFLASLQKWSLGFSFECCCHKEAIINLKSCHLHLYTAIPYRESTGFLQGIPCVVFPPLHALAVYRVWRVQISLKYREIYAFCTGI